MKTLEFNIDINAAPEKVWKVLWDDKTYRQWTSAFGEGSYAVSDWQEGSPIQFLGPNGDGMSSMITKTVPNEYMSFKHLGEIKDGVEQPKPDWEGASENYILTKNGTSTKLEVTIDMLDEHVEFFNKAFPIALENVKRIAES